MPLSSFSVIQFYSDFLKFGSIWFQIRFLIFKCKLWFFFSQVQKVKRDYERLSKKHVKQIKEHQREKDKSHTDLHESSSEIGRLNNKLLVCT